MFSDLFHGVLGLIGGVFTVVIQLPHVSLTHTRNVSEYISFGDVGIPTGKDVVTIIKAIFNYKWHSVLT